MGTVLSIGTVLTMKTVLARGTISTMGTVLTIGTIDRNGTAADGNRSVYCSSSYFIDRLYVIGLRSAMRPGGF